MFKYPHSDLHGLNLDWLLAEWKNFVDNFTARFQTSVHQLPVSSTPTVTVTYDINTDKYDFDFGFPVEVKPIAFQIGYQSSSSGTIIPTGTPWLNNPPIVAQGDYLWTRNMAIYNDGNYYATYSVSRMGIDGTGTGALYFKNVPVSAMTGDIATISDPDITSDHVLAEIYFYNPEYISTNLSWTSGTSSFILNGTCTTATTADIVLIKKIN